MGPFAIFGWSFNWRNIFKPKSIRQAQQEAETKKLYQKRGKVKNELPRGFTYKTSRKQLVQHRRR